MMNDEFFQDDRERDLYLSVASGLHKQYPHIGPEDVDSEAWEAIKRYRARCQPDPIPDAGPTPADMRGEVDHD